LYEHKYAEVKSTYYHGWVVCLNIVDKFGKTLHRYSVQFRENEWKELCQIFQWIEHKHMECVQMKEEEKKKRKAFNAEFDAAHKNILALMYTWSCLQDRSQNYFFTEEHARQDALKNTQKEHQDNILVQKQEVPVQYEMCDFMKFAFAFVWAQEYLKLEIQLKMPDSDYLDWKISMEQVEVKKDFVRTLFVQFYLAQGLPVSDFDNEWDKLQKYASKPELQNLADSLVKQSKCEDRIYSPLYMICDEVYQGLQQGKPTVPSPVPSPTPFSACASALLPFPNLLIDEQKEQEGEDQGDMIGVNEVD